METKTRAVFLSAALAVTLACGWGTVSASPVYEDHFDVYRAIKSADARERSAKASPTHLARHRSATSPVVLSDAPHARSTPVTRVRPQ